MSERRQRSTRNLSRENVQLMLEMKSLLRKYNVTISLTDPDVHDLLIQAAAVIDDEEIAFLRLRLMAAKNPESGQPVNPRPLPKRLDEENPFIDEEEEPSAADPVFTMPSVAPNDSDPYIEDSPSLAALEPDSDSVCNVYIQGPFVEDEVDVFLEVEETQAPPTKRVALNTPRTGLLRCDQCQRTSTVMAAASQDEAIEVQCACGMVYRVIMDSRKYDRKLASLPGFYIDQLVSRKFSRYGGKCFAP